MKSWITWAIVAVVILAVAIVAYSLGSKSPSVPEATVPSTESNTGSAASANTPVEVEKEFTIKINNFAFSPSELKISAGSNVTWVNEDSTPHTVNSDTGGRGGIGSGILDPGMSYTKQFLTAGTYPYHCNFHSSMKGKIVVE